MRRRMHGVDQLPRSENIVLHCFANVALYHGHVFVGGRVEYGVDRALIEHVGEGVANVGEGGDHLEFRVRFAQLAFNPEEIAFGLIERYNARRAKACELPAELAADGTRRARHQDTSSRDPTDI